MSNNQIFKVYDFSGGLNEKGQNVHLKENETPYCKNVVFDELGALAKRKGYSSLLDTAIGIDQPIDGLYIFHKNDGTRYMIAVAGGGAYRIDEENRTASLLQYGDGTSVNDLSDTDYVGFTTWGNTCYIANGVDPIMEFDGTSVVKWDSAIPKGKYITSHKNMIFWAGDSTSPSELYFSEISPPAGSPGSYKSIKFQTDDGDKIMNIIKQQDNLVVFKTDSIHVLYGSSEYNFSKREVQPTIGTIAPKTVTNLQNSIFFLYRDGVYIFDGSNTKLISNKIEPTIMSISEPNQCAGAVNNQKYFLAYSDGIVGSTNDKVMVFSTIHGSWTRFDNYPVNMWNNFDGSQDGAVNLEELYFGSAEEGQIYKVGTGYDDDGEDISVEWRSKFYDMDAIEIVKTFRHIMVDNLTVGSFKFTYDVDKGTITRSFDIVGLIDDEKYLWDSQDWADDDGTIEDNELVWSPDESAKIFGSPLPSGTYGRNIRFIITDSSQENLKLFGITLNYRPRRKRIVR